MTTVSAVVFLYAPTTTLASVAVLNMDDAGDIAPAAAMGMMILYTNAGARIVHLILSKGVLRRTQAWRFRLGPGASARGLALLLARSQRPRPTRLCTSRLCAAPTQRLTPAAPSPPPSRLPRANRTNHTAQHRAERGIGVVIR